MYFYVSMNPTNGQAHLIDALHDHRACKALGMGVGQNPVALVNVKIACKGMLIPQQNESLGIDP